MKLRSGGADDTRGMGEALASLLAPGDVVVLAGEMGVGKTVFAQGIGRGLGVEGPVTSPSFVIVREYEGRVPFAHVDVYRLDHMQELFDLGFEEVVDDRRVTVVEWGDRVAPLLPESRIEIALSQGPERPHGAGIQGTDLDEREIECVTRGPGWAGREPLVERALAPWAEGDGGGRRC